MLEAALLAALVLAQDEAVPVEAVPVEAVSSGTTNVEDYTLATGREVDVGSGVTRVTVMGQFPTPSYGYFPLVIHIDNTFGPNQTVKLSFNANSGSGSRTYARTVDVEAHERRNVVLPVPTNMRSGVLHARGPGITKGGDSSLYLNPVAAKQRAVLNIGTADSFMEAVGARPSYSSSSETQVVTFSLLQAPSELAPYIGWDAVVVSGGKLEQLNEGQRRALEAYAALGGQLVLMQSARGMAAAFPLLASDTPQYGLGRVTFCDHCGYPEALRQEIRVPLRAIEPRGRRGRYAYAYDGDEPVTELSLPVAQTPIGKFLLIIAAFTLAIGPGSLWIARKKGPSLLLLTIPGTAALTCALIVGYSLLRDGFTVHATFQGFTLLDARQHRAITASVGAFYANLAPGGAHFPPDAIVVSPTSAREYQSVDQAAGMTYDEGTKLGADFIPSRSYLEWTLLSVQPTRARLVVKSVGPEELRVQNALGSEIEVAHLVQDGRTYVVTSLKDGEEKVAKAVKTTELIELTELDKRISTRAREALMAPLRSGEFFAKTLGPGFTPLGGLRLQDNDSRQLVRGGFER